MMEIAITDAEHDTLRRLWNVGIERARRRIMRFGRGDTFDMPQVVEEVGISVLIDWTQGSARLFRRIDHRVVPVDQSPVGWRFVLPHVQNPCMERPIMGTFDGDLDAFRNDLMGLRIALG